MKIALLTCQKRCEKVARFNPLDVLLQGERHKLRFIHFFLVPQAKLCITIVAERIDSSPGFTKEIQGTDERRLHTAQHTGECVDVVATSAD